MNLAEQYVTKEVDIAGIKPGHTVLHNGSLRTVSREDIKKGEFFGRTLFGDSYNVGRKSVILVGSPHWVAGKFAGYAF